jgi:hypothetical protein
MTQPAAALAPVRRLFPQPSDPVREAVGRLASRLPARADASVLVDLLEDDLREGLDALEDVQAHFMDLLESLERPTPLGLVQAADDQLALQRLEVLFRAVGQIRRRLNQAAGMMRQR